jgi:transposase
MDRTHHRDAKARSLAERGALHPHPERIQDILFHSGLFFDARDLIQVRYEMVRRFRTDGRAASQVARSYGVSRQSLYLTAQAFREFGLPGLFPGKRGPRLAHKCTDKVLAFVRDCQSRHPHCALDELLHNVRQHFGIDLHRRTLERHLGKKLRRSNQSPRRRTPEPSICRRATSACVIRSARAARRTLTKPAW